MDFRKYLRFLGLKDSRARRAIAFNQLGQPQFSPRNYESFSREGYQKNVIANRAISGIANAAKGIAWTLFSKRGSSKVMEITDHPLLTLLNLRPNPMQGGASFTEAMVAYLNIAGNSFVEAVSPKTGPPTELWPLRPDRFNVIPGERGIPSEYVFRAGAGTVRFPVDQIRGKSPILHMKFFNPLNDWWGQSPMEAASYSVDQHNESGIWNLALLQNKATPSGALVVETTDANPSGRLDDETFKKLKQEIDDRFTGSKNAGRPMLLEGGMDWKEMSISPKDMDWIKGKNISARDVALAFGYPPILLSIQGDTTYSNYKEARLALYEDTVLPTMDFIRDEFNNWLTPAFGDNLFIDYDRDSIPALAIKRALIFERVNKATFLTFNEKRAATDFEPVEGGDVILVNAGLIPLDIAIGGGEDDEPDDNPDDDPDDEKQNITPEKKQTNIRFDDFVTRWVANNVGTQITKIYGTTKKKVIRVVRDAVANNIAEGETLAELTNDIQKRITKTYKGFTKTRSRTIARTETTVASNNGSRGAAKALNIPNLKKEWVSDLSDTARGTSDTHTTNHIEMNGVKVEMDEKFLVFSVDGFDEMEGPGDSTAPADQIINCKCVQIYSTPEKSFNLTSEAAKRRFWLKNFRERQRVERRFATQISAVFKKERELLVDNLKDINDLRLVEIIIEQTYDETSKIMAQVLTANETQILIQFGADTLKLGEDA